MGEKVWTLSISTCCTSSSDLLLKMMPFQKELSWVESRNGWASFDINLMFQKLAWSKLELKRRFKSNFSMAFYDVTRHSFLCSNRKKLAVWWNWIIFLLLPRCIFSALECWFYCFLKTKEGPLAFLVRWEAFLCRYCYSIASTSIFLRRAKNIVQSKQG